MEGAVDISTSQRMLRTDVSINGERLYDSLQTLGRIGAYFDEPTGLTGLRRLALTDTDRQGRERVRQWMQAAGLSIGVDAIGNVFARRAGSEDSLPPVMMGSHIDSVPTAGIFDGMLGVLGALEVIRTLNDAGITTRRPLVMAFFTDEEGLRFGTDMLGSAVTTGRIPLEAAYAIKDADGLAVRDELERIGFLGDEPVKSRRPHAYVECHIEQGPVLIRAGIDIGVVTGVQAISWQEVVIHGRAAHAGTTPTAYRRDAGLVAAKINLRMREMALSGNYGEMRATMGVIRPYPGGVNVIPGRVTATVDLRNPDDEAMARAEADLRAYCDELARTEEVTMSWRQTAKTAAVAFNPTVQQLIEEAARARGLSTKRLIAGAGHDAQEWSRLAKTAMVFVPGEYDGISHNPRELSTPKQCADGINTLLTTVLALADEA